MEKFEIYSHTLPFNMNFEDALKCCKILGDSWRLPTKDELNEMFKNHKDELGDYGVWSSTEYNNDYAWSQGFTTGNIYINPKTNVNKVRPVRTLTSELYGADRGRDWWANLTPPLAPSDNDARIFKDYLLNGTTLLLGCTKNLIPLSDVQMDIDPWYVADTVITQDWTTNTKFYDNIIGDGVLNLDKELAEKVLDMCYKHCDNFVVRCFNRKLPNMTVASHFPNKKDFLIPPTIIEEFDEYTFYIWNFYK